MQILLELLFDSLLELELLAIEAVTFEGLDDFNVWSGLLASQVRIDIQLKSSDIIHILMIYLSLLELVVGDLVLKRFKHFMPNIDVDVQLLDI